MTIGIGLRPLARPTAREAALVLPIRCASSPYDEVSPYPISHSCCQTCRWKSVPTGATGRSNSLRSRSKYARSWRAASASTGLASSRSPRGRPSWSWNGVNSIWVMALSFSTRRSAPTGLSMTVQDMSVLLALDVRGGVGDGGHEGVPEMHERVGAPRPPPLAVGDDLVRLVAQVGDGAADSYVGGQEHVGVTEGAHGDVVRRPRTDAGEGEQRGAYFSAVPAPVECDVTVGQGSGQPGQGAATAARHGQLLRIDLGQRRGGGEEVGEPGDVGLDGGAVSGDQPAGDGAGTGDADLLADHRADRCLVAVDLPWHPQSARATDQRPDHGVAEELVVDGHRV